MSVEIAHTVGELTSKYSPNEGFGSDYDLAKDFLLDDVDWVNYTINHDRAKTARLILGRFSLDLRALIARKASGDEPEYAQGYRDVRPIAFAAGIPRDDRLQRESEITRTNDHTNPDLGDAKGEQS